MRKLSPAWVLALTWALAVGSCEQGPDRLPAPRPPSEEGPPVLHASDSPETVAERTIKAHGGLERLERWKCGRVKYKVRSDTIPLLQEKPSAVEEWFQFPGRFKRVAVIGKVGRQKTVTWLVNKEQGWEYQPDGTTRLLPSTVLVAAWGNEHPFANFCNLSRLRTPDVRLSVQGTDTVSGRSVVILHVVPPPDLLGRQHIVDYSFDARTALLLRAIRHLPPAPGAAPGPDHTVETILGDYRTVESAPVPMRLLGRADGQVLLDFAIEEIELLDSLPPETFMPPE